MKKILLGALILCSSIFAKDMYFKGYGDIKCINNVLYFNKQGLSYNIDTDKPYFCKNIISTTDQKNDPGIVLGIIIYSDKEMKKQVGGSGDIQSLEEMKKSREVLKEISTNTFLVLD